jgi:hypothetical protein
MAQTKRKRRTKHRGNAAGTIETRGRTGRPPSADEKKRQARQDRLSKPPTWSGSAKRAGLAAIFMFVFLLITDHPKNGGSAIPFALSFAILAMVLYIPAGYYLERFLWKRRMAKQEPAPRKR